MERASLLPNRLAAHFTCPSLLLALAVTLPSHLLPFGQKFDTAALEKGRGWRQDGHWRAERLECIVLLLQHLHILIRNMHDTKTNKKIVPENAGLVATHLRKDLEGRGGDTPNKGDYLAAAVKCVSALRLCRMAFSQPKTQLTLHGFSGSDSGSNSQAILQYLAAYLCTETLIQGFNLSKAIKTTQSNQEYARKAAKSH